MVRLESSNAWGDVGAHRPHNISRPNISRPNDCDDEVLGSDSKLGPCGFHAQKPSEAFGWRPGPQERHAGRLLAVNVRVWCACAGGDVRTSRVGR